MLVAITIRSKIDEELSLTYNRRVAPEPTTLAVESTEKWIVAVVGRLADRWPLDSLIFDMAFHPLDDPTQRHIVEAVDRMFKKDERITMQTEIDEVKEQTEMSLIPEWLRLAKKTEGGNDDARC